MLQTLLDHGVTTIKSTGDIPETYIKVRERLLQGELQGPRLFLAGPPPTAPGGHPAMTIFRDNPWLRKRSARQLTSVEEAREVVRNLSDQGVDFSSLSTREAPMTVHPICGVQGSLYER